MSLLKDAQLVHSLFTPAQGRLIQSRTDTESGRMQSLSWERNY